MTINGQDNHSFGHEGENMELFKTVDCTDCRDLRQTCQTVPISSLSRICCRKNFCTYGAFTPSTVSQWRGFLYSEIELTSKSFLWFFFSRIEDWQGVRVRCNEMYVWIISIRPEDICLLHWVSVKKNLIKVTPGKPTIHLGLSLFNCVRSKNTNFNEVTWWSYHSVTVYYWAWTRALIDFCFVWRSFAWFLEI